MKTIEIDLKKINQPKSYEKENEVFQYEAFEHVKTIFHRLLDDIGKKEFDDISKVRRHDTVFIDGERGTGKTAFLLNIESRIDLKENAKFFGPIDPTLLHDSEEFLAVILGKIVQKMEDVVNRFETDNEEKFQQYFDTLEKVSRSLQAVSELKKNNVTGIEAIASNASSEALETHVHNFFGAVRTLLDTRLLVILIDDVDMAFSKGFDVLETVRKFLASPYIVPVVSGDGNLYKRLVENQFIVQLDMVRETDSKQLRLREGDKEQLAGIVEQYLNKVFPNDNRVVLKPIDQILRQSRVWLRLEDMRISYNQFKDFDLGLINYGINQVRFIEEVIPDRLRSFVQYLGKKRKVIESIPKEMVREEDEFLRPYTPEKEKELLRYFFDNRFEDVRKSFWQTAEFYRFSADPEQSRLSKMLYNDLYAFKDMWLSPYGVFGGSFFQDDDMRTDRENDRIMCDIQKETLNREFYIAKEQLSVFFERETSGVARAVTRLFYYASYYNRSAGTRAYIFTGKFIEALLYSFEMRDPEKKEEYKRHLNRIIEGRPYNADIKKNYIDETDVEASDIDIEASEEEGGEAFNVLVEDIVNWNRTYVSGLRLPFTTARLHHVLHKYFNNLNVLKSENTLLPRKVLAVDEGSPCRLFARFCAILLNAVAFFETDGEVSETNIAVGTNGAFSFTSLKNSEAYRKNLRRFVETGNDISNEAVEGQEKNDSDEGVVKENKTDILPSVTSTLYHHPFVKYLLQEDQCALAYRFQTQSNVNLQNELKKVREQLLNRNDITLQKSLDLEKVKNFFDAVENSPIDGLTETVVANMDKRGTREYRLRKETDIGQRFYERYARQ